MQICSRWHESLRSIRHAAALLVILSSVSAGAQRGDVVDRFTSLTKSTRWREAAAVPIRFDTYHPQGMTRVGNRFFLSSVQVIDRAQEKGLGHLFEHSDSGELLRSIKLGEGPMYHPGGIDYDGEHIWVSVAEYRPDSRSIVYAVDPQKLVAHEIFRFGDHLGAIARLPDRNELVAVSWGSRRFYRWALQDSESGRPPTPESADAPRTSKNPSHYIDYQDMQAVADGRMLLCSGLNGLGSSGGPRIALGGIDLLETESLTPVYLLPMPLWTAGGGPMTQNPFHIEITGGRLRAYFIPEDNRSTMYVFESPPP